MPTDQSLDINTTEDAAVLLEYGRAASARNDKPTARSALRKATKLDPDNPAVWVALAQVVGTFNERRQALERALQLDPGNITAQGALEALKSGLVNPHPAPPPVAPVLVAPAVPTAELASELATATPTCYRHPNVETGLRCFQCDKPICAKCAKATPVGHLCPDCRKARRSPLYQIEPVDVVKAVGVGLVAGLLGSLAVSFVGGAIFLLIFFVGPLLGEGVMRMITWATKKRGPIMQGAAAGSIAVGAGLGYLFLGGTLFSLIIFLVIAIGFVVARLK